MMQKKKLIKTTIEWCDYSWSPVIGCVRGCSYCYAKKMVNRFGEKRGVKSFNSRHWFFWEYSVEIIGHPCRIFVGPMTDIAFWQFGWILDVLEKIKCYPQHTFIFLTKSPEVYKNYNWPKNCWIGVTVTGFKDLARWNVLAKMNLPNLKFISMEPLLENQYSDKYLDADWIILGLETGRKKAFNPDSSIIADLICDCREQGVPLFMKDSVCRIWRNKLIQEWPV